VFIKPARFDETNRISVGFASLTFTYPLVSVLMYGPEMRELSISCLGADRLATYGPLPILIDTWH
jgi:hypothetical protein